MTRRLAVVTGGGKGIGRAVTLKLATMGHLVVALGREEAALAATAASAADLWGEVAYRRCDVTVEEDVDAVFREIGPVDILVNNAGIAESNPLPRVTLEDWNLHVAANATSAFLCIRAVITGMRERGWGRIVSVGSTASLGGARYLAAYTASKHALLGLGRVAAAEAEGTGVTVNTVCPAFVRTDMTKRSVANIVARTGRSPEEAELALASSTGLSRFIEPEEVAAAVAYLVSEEAAAVNGQVIVLDGGAIHH